MIRTRAVIRTRGWRGGVVFGLPAFGLAVVVGWELAGSPAGDDSITVRLAFSAALLSLAGYVIAGVRLGPVRELRQVRAVAYATQRVLLRPLPARIDGLAVAASQLSASGGAMVGGDLYEALATVHGVRLVIGDVRGHGLAAIGAVAAVLGSFREAAHDEPALPGVARRLERALERHLRERSRQEHPAAGGAAPGHPSAEEFVTVLLLQIDGEGGMTAVNCGHPWPYRLGKPAGPLCGGDPLPPLGTFPLPAAVEADRCGRLLPGDALLLHTDGATDARDPAGRFFRLEEALSEAAADGVPAPARVIQRVHGALLRHTGGRITDDVALLVLRNDRRRALGRPDPVRTARSAL
ncbi:PP2C family protein-serine/threonine phosphatase [Streptomyces sp. NPDC090052]|uniref:PP2C family protein-serine/threonine phosphatase n=1 Tax=Streptomyces sp. NPDC090052 TaxID=3365931 RepID=UPI0037FEE34E